MNFDVNRTRKTVKPVKCPNPLFEKWLDEWRLEAASRNSDLQYAFAKALQSLRKYPLKLNNGRECLILKNFGTQLCVKLDRKLAEYKKENPEFLTDISQDINEASTNLTIYNELSPKKPVKRKNQKNIQNDGNQHRSSPSPKKNKPYIPSIRSGPYAILITLYQEQNQPNCKAYLTKKELQSKAQNLCDSSFTRPEPGSYYTAWSSVSILIKKGLVVRQGSPAKFSLTDTGKELACKLYNEMESQSNSTDSTFQMPPVKSAFTCLSVDEYLPTQCSSNVCKDTYIDLTDDDPLSETFQSKIQDIPSAKDIDKNNESSGNSYCSTVNCDFEQLIFLPGEFEIILLVDKQETSNRAKQLIADTVRELTNLKTRYEIRHLKVGDFTWISRDCKGKELLLPFIVERKRMDDLCDSIKDGRFHEQKFRLAQCGLTNVIYLVEKFGTEVRGLPMSTLQQAIVNTQMVDNFMVKITNNHHESMTYLSVMTNLLANAFKDKMLISCLKSNLPKFDISEEVISLVTFEEFSKLSAKNRKYKVQEMFVKQLLQLKGLSTDKALAITKKYSTPRNLIAAFETSERKDLMLADIQYGNLNRCIGPVISKTIYQLYFENNLS